MPKYLLDAAQGHSLCKEQGRARMSQVVEPQARQPCLLEDSLESSGDIGAVEWLAGRAREDKILFVPFLTEAKPLL